MRAYRKDFPGPEFNGQFDKLTDRSEGTPVPELAEGAAPRFRQLRVCGVPFLAFNIDGFQAYTDNDGRWFLSPEGANCDSPG